MVCVKAVLWFVLKLFYGQTVLKLFYGQTVLKLFYGLF